MSGRTSLDRKLSANGHVNGLRAAPNADLTPEHLALVQELKQSVQHEIKDSEALQRFVTDGCCVRYLRARNWRLPAAVKMMQATLAWRRQYKPEAITFAHIAPEAETGKQFLVRDMQTGGVARDASGRPMLVLRPRCENTKTYDRQMQYVVYHLETASWHADQLNGLGDGKMTWIVDFVGYTYSTAPPLSSAIQTLKVLQNHYPERLGISVSYLPPKVFQLTWKAIQPFMDPLTKEKVHFINTAKDARAHLSKLCNLKDIEKCMSGDSEYVFNFEEYRAAREADDHARAVAKL